MKKVLFTLVTLLVSVSALADPHFYMDPLEITEADLNKNIVVPVKLTTDYAINAGTVKLTMPDGLVLRKFDKGSSLANLTYFDDYGDEYTADNTIFTPAVATSNFAFATVDKGYYEVDGEWVYYGAVKLLPGEYDEIAKVTIRVTAVPDNAVIILEQTVSCGSDARPWVPRYEGLGEETTEIPVNPAEDEPEDFVGTADVEFVGNVAHLSYTSNDPNATVVVTVDGEAVELEFVNGEATYEVEETTVPGTYNVVVALTVTPDGENYVGEPASDSATYTYTVNKPAFDALAEVVFQGNVAHLTYVANDPNAVVTVMVDGEVVELEFVNGEATYEVVESTVPGTYNVTVELTVAPSNNYEGEPVSDSATYTYTVNKPTFEAEAEVVFQGNVAHLSYEANDPNAVVTVKVDGEIVELNWNRNNGEATYEVVESTVPGTHTVTVELTVAPSNAFEGDAVTASDSYTYTVLETTEAPVIEFIHEGEYASQFIITNDYADGTEIHVYVDGVEIQMSHDELSGDDAYWIIAEVDQDVTHVITVTAQEPGKNPNSTTQNYVKPGRPDGVNELVNGKTVAGVRYFNMAGQEMQKGDP